MDHTAEVPARVVTAQAGMDPVDTVQAATAVDTDIINKKGSTNSASFFIGGDLTTL
jgi:hypothetical protein